MTQKTGHNEIGFSLSPEFFELFKAYCFEKYPQVSRFIGSIYGEVVYVIMINHVLKLIEIFSQKEKAQGKYTPCVIGSRTRLTDEFIEEFLQRIRITRDGSAEFLAQLHKELLDYAKRSNPRDKGSIYWDAQKNAIVVVSYEVPKLTFGEKYKLGEGHRVCIDLLTRIEIHMLGVGHHL